MKRILNSQLTMVRSIIDFIQSPPVLFCQQFFLLNARTRTILSQFQESANSQLFKTISVSHITVIVASGISLGVILIVISVAFLIGLPFKRNLFFQVYSFFLLSHADLVLLFLFTLISTFISINGIIILNN